VADLEVAASLQVNYGKAMNMPESVYLDGKLAEKKSMIADAHGGCGNQRMNGVNTILASSIANSTTFIEKSFTSTSESNTHFSLGIIDHVARNRQYGTKD